VEIQPDLVLLRPPLDSYREGAPTPGDAFLVVEVADASVSRDREKLARYAEAGIPEAWIVNLGTDVIEIYRGPGNDGYRDASTVGRGGQVAPGAFPDLRLTADDILG